MILLKRYSNDIADIFFIAKVNHDMEEKFMTYMF